MPALTGFKSLSENSEGVLFCAPGSLARRDEGEYPLVGLRLRSNEAREPGTQNPPGGGPFDRGQRWLSRHSPLWGCSDLAALLTAKIPRRSTPPNFQTGSNTFHNIFGIFVANRFKPVAS